MEGKVMTNILVLLPSSLSLSSLLAHPLPCVPLMGAFPTVGLRGPRRSDPEPGLSASRLPGPETLARLLPAVHLLLDLKKWK